MLSSPAANKRGLQLLGIWIAHSPVKERKCTLATHQDIAWCCKLWETQVGTCSHSNMTGGLRQLIFCSRRTVAYTEDQWSWQSADSQLCYPIKLLSVVRLQLEDLAVSNFTATWYCNSLYEPQLRPSIEIGLLVQPQCHGDKASQSSRCLQF